MRFKDRRTGRNKKPVLTQDKLGQLKGAGHKSFSSTGKECAPLEGKALILLDFS